MSFIVCKFGGSSVCNADMFLRVRDIIRADRARKYIVLSAPGKRSPNDEKITDLLCRAHEAECAGNQYIFSQIFQRYASIRDRLAPDFDLEAEFAAMQGNHSKDYILSRGEYLCAKLFAAFMGWPFVDAADLFIFREDGIDAKETRRRIRSALLTMDHAVIPGFYGASSAGIRTFSRGGSDVSGSLLAAALEAEAYENWTDVDGLFSADPSIVPDARRHRCVNLLQMERIARAGANLLHPDALLPLKGTGIQTIIKNTRAPQCPGTTICEYYLSTVPCITGTREMWFNENCPEVPPGRKPFEGSLPVDVISAFGLSLKHLDAVNAAVNPIHIIHMQDHKQIIIEAGHYAESIQKIHNILMQDNII